MSGVLLTSRYVCIVNIDHTICHGCTGVEDFGEATG